MKLLYKFTVCDFGHWNQINLFMTKSSKDRHFKYLYYGEWDALSIYITISSITTPISLSNLSITIVPTLPRQNGRNFTDDTFNRIFVNENVRISIESSLKFVPKVPNNNTTALVQIMAWRRPGDKPLSEPVMVSLLTHICVTRPQWVNDRGNPPSKARVTRGRTCVCYTACKALIVANRAKPRHFEVEVWQLWYGGSPVWLWPIKVGPHLLAPMGPKMCPRGSPAWYGPITLRSKFWHFWPKGRTL